MSGPRYQPKLALALEDASRAYRRRDDDAFRVALLEAIALAPERLDIALCLANLFIQTNRPDQALHIYEEIAAVVPSDTENLFRLAHWVRFMGDDACAEKIRRELSALRPSFAEDLSRIWAHIDEWFARPVTDAIPSFPALPESSTVRQFVARPAVLILGYALFPDGTARPELLARLRKGLAAANLYPDADIVVSGGVPQAGRAESAAMREWLEAAGIVPERIAEEAYSRDVVENLVYSRHILARNGNDAVLVVTSPVDVRRAASGLRIMADACGDVWRGAGRVLAAAAPAEGEIFTDDGRDRLKIYRDALRSYGMPMMNVYPGLSER